MSSWHKTVQYNVYVLFQMTLLHHLGLVASVAKLLEFQTTEANLFNKRICHLIRFCLDVCGQ